MEDASTQTPRKFRPSEGVRRLSLALGVLSSSICLVVILYSVADDDCGLGIFLGLQDCGLRPANFENTSFRRVLHSASFQSLPAPQQIEWVHNQFLRQLPRDHDYHQLAADAQREFAEGMLARHRANRPWQAMKLNLAVSLLIGMSFLVPWGLVRLVAWIIAGFRSDRLAQ